MKKTPLILVVGLLIIVTTYFSVRIWSGYQKGYKQGDMDWNQDGRTSITEIIESSDIGLRTIIVDGVQCIEYFAYKDGLPIKVVCSDGQEN